MSPKRVVLAIALLATLGAAYFAPATEGDVVQPSKRSEAMPGNRGEMHGKNAANNADGLAVLTIRPRPTDDAPAEVFVTMQWAEPAPIEPIPPVAPPITIEPPPIELVKAPPVPFSFLGRYEDNGENAIFLQYNNKNIVARTGDVIADQYRVDSIGEGLVTLIYLPLNEKQNLRMGSSR